MADVRDWNDIYLALAHRAENMRGYVELEPDTVDAVRWPRTTGADVIAIAALINPHVQRSRSDVLRWRWNACTMDIARNALVAPRETYRENRAFWACLARACVYLASIEASMPDPALWRALLEQLGDVLALRNAGPKGDGPFKRFESARTFDDLYIAQAAFLRGERGGDSLDAGPGMPAGTRVIPRSTNRDVVVLADYWSKQLAAAKRVMGHERIEKRWADVLRDVDAHARSGNPDDVYAHNNAFWRALQSVAVQVAVADEHPSNWDLAMKSLADSVVQLPNTLKAGAEAVANGISDVAQGAAKGVARVAGAAGSGLFGSFGTPLLIGGGLLGLFLISRARKSQPEGK